MMMSMSLSLFDYIVENICNIYRRTMDRAMYEKMTSNRALFDLRDKSKNARHSRRRKGRGYYAYTY